MTELLIGPDAQCHFTEAVPPPIAVDTNIVTNLPLVGPMTLHTLNATHEESILLRAWTGALAAADQSIEPCLLADGLFRGPVHVVLPKQGNKILHSDRIAALLGIHWYSLRFTVRRMRYSSQEACTAS